MFKKVAMVAVALAIAAPVFAKLPGPFPPKDEGGITQTSYLKNIVVLNGSSGNLVLGKVSDGYVLSGAVNVGADVYNQANVVSADCHCVKGADIKQTSHLVNFVKLTGSSGNVVYGNVTKDGEVSSGVVSLSGVVQNFVNTVTQPIKVGPAD